MPPQFQSVLERVRRSADVMPAKQLEVHPPLTFLPLPPLLSPSPFPLNLLSVPSPHFMVFLQLLWLLFLHDYYLTDFHLFFFPFE